MTIRDLERIAARADQSPLPCGIGFTTAEKFFDLDPDIAAPPLCQSSSADLQIFGAGS